VGALENVHRVDLQQAEAVDDLLDTLKLGSQANAFERKQASFGGA
jgi:hypothetical protein